MCDYEFTPDPTTSYFEEEPVYEYLDILIENGDYTPKCEDCRYWDKKVAIKYQGSELRACHSGGVYDEHGTLLSRTFTADQNPCYDEENGYEAFAPSQLFLEELSRSMD